MAPKLVELEMKRRRVQK